MSSLRILTRPRGRQSLIVLWIALFGLSLLIQYSQFMAPASVFAAGPGNNGLDPTGNGNTSDATAGASLSAAGGSATMGTNAVLLCTDSNVGSLSGSFTLTKDLDVGSKITVYLVPNNGSDASPVPNVPKNETTVTLTSADNASGSVVTFTVTITSPFTETSGGILAVFAVNADNVTAISSSKSNSLNCTEAGPTPTPTPTPTLTTPTTPPTTPGPTAVPTPPSTPVPTATPTGSVLAATATPKVTLPPTDTAVHGGGSSTSSPLGLLLLALAAVSSTLAVLSPARGRRPRR